MLKVNNKETRAISIMSRRFGVFIVTIEHISQPTITCSKLVMETLGQGVKYVYC